MTAETPSRKPRLFLIAVIILCCFILLALAAVYFLPYFLPMGTIKSLARDNVREATGMELDFNSLGFSWSGGVVIDGISLSPPAEGDVPAEPVATVDKVHVNVAWTPLLSGRVVVNRVEVSDFSVRVKRDASGKLNLPDFDKLAAASPSSGSTDAPAAAPDASESAITAQNGSEPAQAAASESGSNAVMALIPAIELKRIDISRGTFSYDDEVENLEVEGGLEFLRIEGGKLEDPFTFSGKFVPFPSTASKGSVDFSGNARLVKDLKFDPNGEALLEINLDGLPLSEYAEKFSLATLLPSGELGGKIHATYQGGKGQAQVAGLTLANVSVGLDGDAVIAVPDTTLAATAEYDYANDRINLSGLSAANPITSIEGGGWIGGVADLPSGALPFGEVDFNGSLDVTSAVKMAADLIPDLDRLDGVQGSVGFSGKWAVGKSEGAEHILATVLGIDLNSGRVVAEGVVPGVSAETSLGGLRVQTVVRLDEKIDVTSSIAMSGLPVTLNVDAVGVPITANIKGGAAFQMAGDAMAAELRLQDTTLDIPKTEWADALKIVNPEARIVFDLSKDALEVGASSVVVNDTIRAGVRQGVITGILAGNPEGTLDAELSTMFESARAIVGDLLPPEITALAGSLRAAARTTVGSGNVSLAVNMEVENLSTAYDDGTLKVSLESAKTLAGFTGNASLDNPAVITLGDIRMSNSGLVAQAANVNGEAIAARLGETVMQTTGVADLGALGLRLTALDIQSTGMSSAMQDSGGQSATLTSGPWVLRTAASAEDPVALPLSGQGDFYFPEIDAGIDNLAFSHNSDGNPEESQLGSFRTKLGIDGFLGKAPEGSDKFPQLNIRRMELLANPVAAQARGSIRLDSLTMAMEYAARFAPARIQSVLRYFQIPPELVSSAEVSGRVSWNGAEFSSAGTAKGGLQFTSGTISPFSVAHDFSASYSSSDEQIHINMKGLSGGVASQSGEAIVTINAQPSTLSIGRTGAQGFIDLRINGTAGPTRLMALGFTSLVPELRSAAAMLQDVEASGVYNTWVQLQGRDNQALVLNAGGIWQGAALTKGGTAFLSEPGRLGASVEGEYVYGQNRINVSKLSFNSDTAQIRAEGNAAAVIAGDLGGGIPHLSGITTNLRFAMGDITRASAVFPGIIPPNLVSSGRVEGQFSASGDTTNLNIDQGVVRLSNIIASPGGLKLSIPDGAATYGGSFSLNHPGSYADDGSDFVPLRAFNVSGGTVSLSGAQIEGRTVTDLSAAFQLANGVFNLEAARFTLSGEPQGTAMASGTVDFNGRSPAVNMRIAAANLPLDQLSGELKDFATIQSGYLNVPAQQGQSAAVAFTGLSEDEILQTVRFDNFTFATGPVVLNTGPLINAELDRARLLLKQEPKGDDSADRVFSFESISGVVEAKGDGVLVFPKENPIRIIGDNTGDFAVSGWVSANHTLDMDAMVAGKLEKILTFSLPSIIPNLSQQPDEQRNQFMNRMNQNAANGHYKLRVSGPLERPQISGIPELVARILTDIPLAAPFAILGGILNLGMDLPGAVINAPQNITQGIGGIIGSLTGSGGGSQQSSGQESSGGETEQQSSNPLPNLLRGLRR